MAAAPPLLPLVLAVLLGLAQCQAQEDAKPPCATECHEENCDQMGIRYGRFCGVGHGGCPGVKPCDSIDACCKRHDECVEKTGLFAAADCHKRFLKCLDKNKDKVDGFSPVTCPYDLVVPTMRNGIELALMFTGMVQEPPGQKQQKKRRRDEL